MKKNLLSAVEDLAIAVNTNRRLSNAEQAVIEATSNLPSASFGYWTQSMRARFNNFIWTPPSNLDRAASYTANRPTWLELLCRDGYRREQTLRALTGPAPNALLLTLAIRMLNDGVPQIRDAARTQVPIIIANSNIECVTEAVCQVLIHWRTWGRITELERQVLLNTVSQEPLAGALIRKLMTTAAGPMPSLFSQLGRTSMLDQSLEDLAQQAVQPAIRAKAYRSLLEGSITWIEKREWQVVDRTSGKREPVTVIGERILQVSSDYWELLERSSTDTSSVVRRVAAEVLIKNLTKIGAKAIPLASQFAADKSTAVSERGEFALRKLRQMEWF